MISIILLISLALFALASVYLGYDIQLDEFASYRSRATFTHILFSLLSSLVGGWMFFGLTAIGYEAGVVGYVIGIAYAIGLSLLGWKSPQIKQIMRANNYDTLDEFVGDRYGKVAQSSVSLINLIFFLTVLAAQFVAMTALLTTFVSGHMYLIFGIATIVVVGYTVAAGFKGVLLTDTWQFIIVALAVVLSFILASTSVGIESFNSLPSSHFTGTSYGIVFIIAVMIFFPPSILVRTDLWQRISAAKNINAVRNAFYWTAPLLLIFYFLLTSIGMFARARLPQLENPDQSGLQLVLSIIGQPGAADLSFITVLLLSFFAVGILAALISTIDTNLNVISVALSKLFREDEWKAYENAKDSSRLSVGDNEQYLLMFTRVITALLGLSGAAMAVLIPDIVDLIVSAGAIILVFLPSVLGSLIYDHKERISASSSIIVGFIVFIISLLLLGDPTAAFAPGVVASFIIYGSVRLMKPVLSDLNL